MAKIINGIIVPSSDTLKQLFDYIKEKASSDEDYRQTWENNPRSILEKAGLSRPIQNELLIEIGDETVDVHEFDGCMSCSGCCVSGCGYSG